jgi:hypothetical protein
MDRLVFPAARAGAREPGRSYTLFTQSGLTDEVNPAVTK